MYFLQLTVPCFLLKYCMFSKFNLMILQIYFHIFSFTNNVGFQYLNSTFFHQLLHN